MDITDRRLEGFLKWLNSTKFQVFLIFSGFAFFLVVVYKLNPLEALKCLKDVSIAYMAARVVEPISDLIASKLGKKIDS
jgi:hypothetical protein